MSQVITPVDTGKPPSLSLQDIAALRQGLEEAIALTLRGEATCVTVVAQYPESRGVKFWEAGDRDGGAPLRGAMLGMLRSDDHEWSLTHARVGERTYETLRAHLNPPEIA